jgi:hypothetical protein
MSDFRLLMIGAMYENGGNTTHRFLDGHPGLHVYPFESQVGTRHVNDALSSMFPLKYRWPEFLLDATPAQDFKAIIDEEGKVRARTPNVSKFRHEPFDLDDDERGELYCRIIGEIGRSRAHNMEAFFRATHEAWKDERSSGEEQVYVGYSPIITVDAARILEDLPQAHVLHVVRNPWSAYADTKKRPVPLDLAGYIMRWNLNQHYALLERERFPDRLHIVRTEEVMADPVGTLGGVLERIGLAAHDALAAPSWNGKELEEVYPWGTIRQASPEANLATAHELSSGERDEVARRAWQYLGAFGYEGFLDTGAVEKIEAFT